MEQPPDAAVPSRSEGMAVTADATRHDSEPDVQLMRPCAWRSTRVASRVAVQDPVLNGDVVMVGEDPDVQKGTVALSTATMRKHNPVIRPLRHDKFKPETYFLCIGYKDDKSGKLDAQIGVTGSGEEDEDFMDTMVREVHEETGKKPRGLDDFLEVPKEDAKGRFWQGATVGAGDLKKTFEESMETFEEATPDIEPAHQPGASDSHAPRKVKRKVQVIIHGTKDEITELAKYSARYHVSHPNDDIQFLMVVTLEECTRALAAQDRQEEQRRSGSWRK